MIVNKMDSMLNGIINYLDFTGQLGYILEQVTHFRTDDNIVENSDEISQTLTFSIFIDFPILVDVAGNVANTLLAEPYVVQEMFDKVIKGAVATQETASFPLVNQTHSKLIIKLPPSLLTAPLKSGNSLPTSGLFTISGIAAAYSTSKKYRKSTVYRCTLEECPGRKGQHVFENQLASLMCAVCGCRREQFLRARTEGEQVLAVFVHPKSFQLNFLCHRGFTVSLKDELTKDLELGVCYNVVVSYKGSHLQGWGVERATSESQWRFDHGLPPVGVPSDIILIEENLRKSCPESPWALTMILSSQLTSQTFPLTSFMHLKIGLLLSLASQSFDRTPVPLLAVGPDCCALLQAATELSARRMVLTSQALCGAVGGSATDEWLEAGPLILASGGVCYFGDWAKFSSGRIGTASQIVTALEKGRVDLVQSNNSSALGSPLSLPLRTAVWAIWSGDKATSAAQAQLRTLIEVFGMPFIGDGSVDIEAVAERLLSESMQLIAAPSDNFISMDDLKKYLSIACSIKVHLTPEASKLLRNYFVASRRERPDCLPLTAIKTMTALAEAHARLCLRTQVLYEDVVLIAYLYEESITALYGQSLMSPPPAVFGNLSRDSNSTSIAQQVTIRLQKFSLWLEQYIKSLLSESSVNLSVSEE